MISSSFADIFYNNCFKNGILPIVVDESLIEEISEYSKRKEEISVDLAKQEIKYGNKLTKFKIDEFKKKCLLNGLDDIDLSLAKINDITKYEEKLSNLKPWI